MAAEMSMAEMFPTCTSNGQIKSEDACKLFVGGLSWDTTQEKLNSYFSQFGDVVDCILMMDTNTKRSRGFGFVTYKDPSSVLKVLDSGPHVLDNKSIDPKEAVPRYTFSTNSRMCMASSPNVPRRCNKIFVGGIGQATEDDLRSYFQTYGAVTDVTIMMDKNTGRPRGFAFVGFENVESSETTAQIRYHSIKGKRVEVKVAQPRDSNLKEFCGSSHSPTYQDDRLESEHLYLEGLSVQENGSTTNTSKLGGKCEFPISSSTKNSIVQLLNDIWK